ncbi:glycosyltransferase family 2 protein [Periconia macrospinosa]|uniref:Glycosyltransferase family 2 protein n=1 Tax=Periconia macrospinosa TaxID=97972 RepID=A0A2V1DRH6_9PLEO|nr:glycosyltransferase family 2 protein [Periconia macrospinosa]
MGRIVRVTVDRIRLRQAVWRFLSPSALGTIISLGAYIGYRFKCLISAQVAVNSGKPIAQAGNAQSLVVAWIFFAAELLALIPDVLPYLLRVIAFRLPDRTKLVMIGDNVPNVDVLITCCREDLDVILDTTRAACALDYPRDRFRVFVCDDGASAEVRNEIQHLHHTYPNVYYVARIKDPLIKDYKAGNLNHALHYSRHLPFPLTGLDADMIPEPHWLRTMMPHLIDDPDVALACPPQTFYDIPDNDPLTQTMDQFAGTTELVNDAVGHADCLGSGYVARRSAIDSIGGFPVESLSEDVCCSATLLGAGWKTAFVECPLQYGSVPDSFVAHIKQRTRWFVGHIQTAVLFRLRLFGNRGRRLTPSQRLAGIVFDLRQIIQIPLFLNYILVPFALLSGSSLVTWREDYELKWLIRTVVIFLFCRWFHQVIVGIIFYLGRGWYDVRLPSYDAELEQWMAPYIFMAWLRSFILPTRLGGVKAGFTASGSVCSDLQERDALRRAPLMRRIRISVFHHWVWIHVLLIIACLGGVSLTCIRAIIGFEHVPNMVPLPSPSNITDQMTYLLARIGWPPLLWFQHVCSALVPVMYMFNPPTTPPRETLLVRDEETQIAYPRIDARVVKRDSGTAWRYIRSGLAILYAGVLLVLSEVLL